MRVFKNTSEWFEFRNNSIGLIGFVPTMGALHKGHESLINYSLTENEITVVSIYINPTQFNNKSDLDNYPSHLEDDLTKLKELGVDYVLLPNYDDIYPDNYTYKVMESNFSNQLCGKSRPGHFDGVLTIVMKLLNMVRPNNAYFGEKDYQQFILIREMCNAFFIKSNIISCPIVREDDGLALSSRNERLTKAERSIAPKFYKWLSSSLSTEDIKQNLIESGFKIDYIEEINNRRFGAVFLGNVRLIDNVKI